MFLDVQINKNSAQEILGEIAENSPKEIIGHSKYSVLSAARELTHICHWANGSLGHLEVITASGCGHYTISRSGRITFKGRRNSLRDGNNLLTIGPETVTFHEPFWVDNPYSTREYPHTVEGVDSRFAMIRPWETMDSYCFLGNSFNFAEREFTRQITQGFTITQSSKISNIVTVHERAREERGIKEKDFRLREIERQGTKKLIAIPVGVDLDRPGWLTCYEVYWPGLVQ